MPRLKELIVPAIAATAVVAGCARMGPPPGGPRDLSPPVLIGTLPESVMVMPGFDGWVTFSFDEVIDEGGTPSFGRGNSQLEQLLVISPDSGIPRIRWRRDRLLVQPRTGWMPDAVYRVELLPGIRDLSGNRSEQSSVVTFTTGAPVPTHALAGDVVDWNNRNFLPRALVEAVFLPDSLVYRTRADSNGAFFFSPLPAGEYLIFVSKDENGNGRRDLREPWDSVRLGIRDQLAGEVWVYSRDTLPPRLNQNGTAVHDSFSVSFAFDLPLDTALALPPDSISIMQLPDSVPIPALSGWLVARHDSVYRPIDQARRAAAAAAADTSAAAADSTAPAAADSVPAAAPGVTTPVRTDSVPPDTTRKPRQPRPAITNRLVVRSQAAFQGGTTYRIVVRGIRSLGGTVADSIIGTLVVPAPPPAADTTRAAPPDSTGTATSDPG